MKRKSIDILSCRCRILTAVIMTVLLSAGAYAGRWKQHPGFDMAARKIIDSEQATYFVVLQKHLAKNVSYFNTPVGGILVYDKKNPEKGIIPLAERSAMSGVNVRLAEYSPEGKFLAIVYDNSKLDIISDDGGLRTLEDLCVPAYPGGNVVNSMTLCGKEIWLATETGFMTVDGTTGRVVFKSNIRKAVKWIGRAGDRIVAFYDKGIYDADASTFKGKVSDFSSAGIAGSPANPFALMPVRDGFVYMADRKSGESYSVNLAWREAGKWNYKHLKDILISLENVNTTVANNMERRYTRNKNGWLITGNTRLIQIYADRDPASENIYSERVMSPSVVPAGSWDYESGWGYSARGAFAKGSMTDGKFVFDDHSLAIRPNVPITAHSTHMTYSPLHGIAASNHGFSWAFGNLSMVLPALVSNYDNNRWKTPCYAYNVPESALSDLNYASIYNTYFGRFPCNDPLGISVDPVFPDYVWLGSTRSGLSAINLARPSADPIHLGSSDDPTSGFPGFKEVFPASQGFKGMTPVTSPSFDSDGRMWTAYACYDGYGPDTYGVYLYWWSVEDRRKMMETGDPASLVGNKPLGLVAPSGTNFTFRHIALSHENNRNKIVVYIEGGRRHIQIVDHKGTLDDDTDDETKTVYRVIDQNSANIDIDQIYEIAEDPLSGKVWICGLYSLFCFDPDSKVENNSIHGGVIDITDGDYKGNPFENVNIMSLKFDQEGRMWIGTKDNGLWCVARDRQHILGHYTAENSEIPGNTVYGMEWNPASGSLMISTDNGYAEFWPDLEPEYVDVSKNIYVYPRKVSVDYAGNILVKGVMPNGRINIRNLQNEVVVSLTADKDGNATWNLRDRDGENMQSGIYNVDADGSRVEVVVMR